MLSAAFILSLTVSIATLVRVYRDHNETFVKFKTSSGTERRRLLEKLLWLYGVPILALASAIVSGYSSAATREKIKNLEVRVQPRKITKEQQNVAVRLLKPASDSAILVSYATGNEEQRKYAESFVDVLMLAGFHPKLQTGRMILSIPEGVTAAVKPNVNEGARANVRAISNAFKAADIPIDWVVDSPQLTNLVPVGASVKNKRVGFPFSFEGSLQFGIGTKPSVQH